MIEAFRDRFGIDVIQGWGMTETSPLAAVSIPPSGTPEDLEIDYRVKAGRVVAGVEIRITAEDGIGPAPRRQDRGRVRDPRSLDHRLLLRRRRPRRSSTTTGCAPVTSARSTAKGS